MSERIVTEVKVVDASALAALLFAEPEAEAVADQLGTAAWWHAPFGFDMAHACLIKTRRHPEQRPALTAAFALRHQFSIEEVVHDAVPALAERTRLTAYDASYLWLARQLELNW